jgi:hypothetical protein
MLRRGDPNFLYGDQSREIRDLAELLDLGVLGAY